MIIINSEEINRNNHKQILAQKQMSIPTHLNCLIDSFPELNLSQSGKTTFFLSFLLTTKKSH